MNTPHILSLFRLVIFSFTISTGTYANDLTEADYKSIDAALESTEIVVSPKEQIEVTDHKNGEELSRSQDIRLIGKGFYNPKSKESIGLAIVRSCGLECNELQFIHFYNNGANAKWIGKPFVQGSKKEFKKKMKQINKQSRKYQNYFRDSEAGLAILVMSVAASCLIVIPVGASAVVALPILFIGYSLGFYSTDVFTLLGHQLQERNVSSTMTYKEGWNWESSPKRMRAAKFDRYLSVIEKME